MPTHVIEWAMRRVSITLHGADSAHFAGASRKESRTFLFPDDIHRVISLPGATWQTFDWLMRAKRWQPSDIVEEAFALAVTWSYDGQTDFESDLRKHFARLIKFGRQTYDDLVNDDRP